MVDFRGHRPQHIGYVVEDIQVAVAGLRLLGVEVSEPFPLELDSAVLKVGEPTQLMMAFAKMGDLLIEMEQPVGPGPNPWTRWLEQRGSGIHHLCYADVPSYDETIAELQSNGFALTLAGQYGPDKFCFLEDGPLVIEFTNSSGPVFPEAGAEGLAAVRPDTDPSAAV